MKALPLSQVKARLNELVDVVERRDEALAITRNGNAIAVLVSKDEYDSWLETLAILRDREFMKEIRDGLSRLRRTKKRLTVAQLFDE